MKLKDKIENLARSVGQPPVRQIAKLNCAALARRHTERSIERLAQALDSQDERIAIDAAVRLLDRGHGKPTQTIANGDKSPDQMDDVELLAAIRAAVAGELREEAEDTRQLN